MLATLSQTTVENYNSKLENWNTIQQFMCLEDFEKNLVALLFTNKTFQFCREIEKKQTNYSALNIASFFIDQQQEFNISLIPEFLFHHLPLAKLPLLPIFFSVQATRKTKFIRKLGFFSEREKLLPSSTTNAPRLKNHLQLAMFQLIGCTRAQERVGRRGRSLEVLEDWIVQNQISSAQVSKL